MDWFSVSPKDRTWTMNSQKRNIFLIMKATEQCNSLSSGFANTPTLEVFKQKLDGYSTWNFFSQTKPQELFWLHWFRAGQTGAKYQRMICSLFLLPLKLFVIQHKPCFPNSVFLFIKKILITKMGKSSKLDNTCATRRKKSTVDAVDSFWKDYCLLM